MLADGTMYRSGTSPIVWLVEGGGRTWIASPAEVNNRGGFGKVQLVSSFYPTLPESGKPPKGVPGDGLVVRGDGPEAYIFRGGKRYWFATWQDLAATIGTARPLKLSDTNVFHFPFGGVIGASPDGEMIQAENNPQKLFLMEAGKRRFVPQDVYTLEHYRLNYQLNVIREECVDGQSKGADLPVRQPPPPPPVPPKQPVVSTQEQILANSKKMRTTVTFYANGHLFVQCYTECTHWSEGLRGEFYIVFDDGQANAQWVSALFQCQTMGSKFDPTTPSRKTQVFPPLSLPAELGAATQAVRVFHGQGDELRDPRQGVMEFLEFAGNVATKVKAFFGIMFGAAPVTPTS
jgi:hypothetical protein